MQPTKGTIQATTVHSIANRSEKHFVVELELGHEVDFLL